MSSTTVAKPLNRDAIAAALKAVANLGEQDMVLQAPLSENRPRLVGRVTQTRDNSKYGDSSKDQVVITFQEPDAAYDIDEVITNFNDVVVGRVDKKNSTVTIIPQAMDKYASDLKKAQDAVREDNARVEAYERELQDAIETGNYAKKEALEAQPVVRKFSKGMEVLFPGEEQVFKPGDTFKFNIDKSLGRPLFPKFAVVKISVAATRYAMLKEDTASCGVSFTIKQVEILERANPKKMVDMFFGNPTSFTLPMPTPARLCEENDYFKLTPKSKYADQTFFIPVIPGENRRIEVFGVGAGCQTFWVLGDGSHAYSKRDKVQRKLWLKGALKIVDYPSIEELQRGVMKRTLCQMVSFKPLEFLKLEGVDLHAALAPVVLKHAELVLQCQVDLKDTFKSPMNKLDSRVQERMQGEFEDWKSRNPEGTFVDFLEHENHDWFYEMRVEDTMCDFPAFLEQRGVPLSHIEVQALANNDELLSYSTDKVVDDKVRPARHLVTREIFEDPDLTYFPLHEFKAAALKAFLASDSAKQDYDYIALTSVEQISELYDEALGSLRQFAKKKGTGYVGVLGGPLLNANTIPRPDGVKRYVEKVLKAENPEELVDDNHPLVEMPLQCMLGRGDVFVVYAIDRQKRKSQERDAKLNPLLAPGQGTKRKAIRDRPDEDLDTEDGDKPLSQAKKQAKQELQDTEEPKEDEDTVGEADEEEDFGQD